MFGAMPDPMVQRNALYSQQPPKKVYPPSKIPPRGWRRLRKPKEFKNARIADYPQNAPVLNEMLAYDPHIIPSEAHRTALEKKVIRHEVERHRSMMLKFFDGLINPPDSIETPEDPVIEQLSSFSLHRTENPEAITGPIFSVKELDSVPVFAQDEEPVVMRASRS
jgi:hypothetical protein